MSLHTSEKLKVIKDFARGEADTGSPEVQIALLTTDINKLTEHFKTHANDIHSRRGLIRKVNLRRKLLTYLKKKNPVNYRKVVELLELRG
ncbi:MAG: 30S ribosomal protein S15 [Gammaproteobacteria bacterium]|nr:30S ribosomal protein S15 [Gammaproteobacteria bacterium]